MPASPTALDQLFDFLASVRLALTLLLILAIAAVGGTIVPQNLAPQQYIGEFGPRLYTFLSYLGLFDMYNSWWFRALLAMLAVNLVVCSVKRFPATRRLARPLDPGKLTQDFLKKQTFSRTINLDGPPKDHLDPARTALTANFGAPRTTTLPWGTLLHVEKGAFSRFGVYLVHASLLTILAGAVVGSHYGFSAYLQLPEGQTADRVEATRPVGIISLPFSIRLDRFQVTFYRNGMPSEYVSDVTIIDQGREVLRAQIMVNHPLTYGGVTFYQSSYGQLAPSTTEAGSPSSPRHWSGFQVNQDPGVILIWLGCGLMMFGFIVTFLLSHRKAFIGLAANGARTTLILAGSTHRHQGSFGIKFDRLVRATGAPPLARDKA